MIKYLLGAIVIALTGCVTSNTHNQYVEAQTSQFADYTPLGSVEPTKLDEDPFEGLIELDLVQLIEEVERRNPTLEMAFYAWKSALSRYPQVIALDDPSSSFSLAPETLWDDASSTGLRFDLSQRIPWPGKLALRGKMALNTASAVGADLEAVRQQLSLETRRTFYGYYYVYRAIDINQLNISLLREFLKIAETKYSAGTASKQDVLQAEVEYNHLLHREIVLERMKKILQAKINTLLNRNPYLPVPLPPKVIAVQTVEFDVQTLITEAINYRPELQALAHRIRSQENAVELTHKNYKPDFTVMGAYNSLWRDDDLRPLVGIGINIPLYKNKLQAAEEEAKNELNRLKAELANRVSKVAESVQGAYELLFESRHVVVLYDNRLIPAAKENLKAAKSGYQSGKNDFLTLITAEKNMMTIELGYHKAVMEFHQHFAELERATGFFIKRNGEEKGEAK